jgi:hypothetical protein
MTTLIDRKILVATLFMVPWLVLNAQISVNCWSSGPNAERCRIDQPTVTQRVTECPQIRFHYGDRARIRAGGCAQTGGRGKTWKRYVDPEGPDSDHLYFGLIRLPSFDVDFESNDELNGFKRLSEVMSRAITVTTPPCDPKADCVTKYPGDDVGWLRIGYADDDYSDNGYGGHDDGTDNQCRGIGPAWLELTIERYDPGAGLENGIDRPGLDYDNFDLPQARPDLCHYACLSQDRCKAFTYVKPGVQGERARCWLKYDAPTRVKDDCCVSGLK